MSFLSFILPLRDVDAIVVAVRADPFDPDDALLEIDGYDQPISVALDVEHDPLCRDDTRGRITPLHLGRTTPARLAHFVEPGVESGLERRLIPVPGTRGDELPQRAPSNDPHAPRLTCTQNGRKEIPASAGRRSAT